LIDKQAMENSQALFPTLAYANSASEACDGAEVVLVLTEWEEFHTIDPIALKETVRSACDSMVATASTSQPGEQLDGLAEVSASIRSYTPQPEPEGLKWARVQPKRAPDTGT
jgi:hypothetical protein